MLPSLISFLHGHFVHGSIGLIAHGSKRLDLNGELWHAVLSSTRQRANFQ